LALEKSQKGAENWGGRGDLFRGKKNQTARETLEGQHALLMMPKSSRESSKIGEDGLVKDGGEGDQARVVYKGLLKSA